MRGAQKSIRGPSRRARCRANPRRLPGNDSAAVDVTIDVTAQWTALVVFMLSITVGFVSRQRRVLIVSSLPLCSLPFLATASPTPAAGECPTRRGDGQRNAMDSRRIGRDADRCLGGHSRWIPVRRDDQPLVRPTT